MNQGKTNVFLMASFLCLKKGRERQREREREREGKAPSELCEDQANASTQCPGEPTGVLSSLCIGEVLPGDQVCFEHLIEEYSLLHCKGKPGTTQGEGEGQQPQPRHPRKESHTV